jgi:hypothetical protein
MAEAVVPESLFLTWRFQGRRVPAFVQRLHLGDGVWVRVGEKYRRRCRVVKREVGEPPEGAYVEIELAFFCEDRPEG